jgi:hypothetical protein
MIGMARRNIRHGALLSRERERERVGTGCLGV